MSDRYYLAAWALAFYLTFDRQVLGSGELDEYLKMLDREADPLEAFQVLLGEPLAQAEKKWRHYLMNLRHDGTAGPAK